MTQRNRLVMSLARPYVRRKLRRSFDGVHVAGIDAVRDLAQRGPVIIAMNHVCWWDPLTIFALDAELHGDGRCLMDAANLKKLPFFKWIGAIPLDRSSPRASLADMRRAVDELHHGRTLWIFPQGRQMPAHMRPLHFQAGVHWLAHRAACPVVPLSLSYTYREAPEAAVIARFGRAMSPPTSHRREEWLATLEARIVAGLDQTDEFAMSGTGAFELIVPPRRGTGVPLAGRALARGMTERTPSQGEQQRA